MDTKLVDDIDSTFVKIEWGKDFSILFFTLHSCDRFLSYFQV